MKILYCGDVMGLAGRKVIGQVLHDTKKGNKVDFVIAQGENAGNDGKAPSRYELESLQKNGVDFFSGGNHSFNHGEADGVYENTDLPVVRPANVLARNGRGYQIIEHMGKRILIASLLGQTVGNQRVEITNPLIKIDEILAKEKANFDVSIVNFHGDFSSEKRVIGYYLDGRVSAVIGDHWHVPTADAMILPKGTAHITDVGMCGSLHSSLGVKTDTIIDRWLSGRPSKNEMSEEMPFQFNAVIIELEANNKPVSIRQIQKII